MADITTFNHTKIITPFSEPRTSTIILRKVPKDTRRWFDTVVRLYLKRLKDKNDASGKMETKSREAAKFSKKKRNLK